MRIHALFAAVLLALPLASCVTVGGGPVRQNIASEYYAIAEGYAGLSKFDKAILYYRKAALHGDFTNAAHYGLGRMYALTGKWQEASDMFSGLYGQDPENLLVSTAYAYSLAANGRKEEALALYAEVWRKNSDDPLGMRNYAAMLVLSERYEEALAVISALKTDYPDSDAVKGIEELEKKAVDALKPPEEGTDGDLAPETTEEGAGSTEAAVIEDSAVTVPEKPAP